MFKRYYIIVCCLFFPVKNSLILSLNCPLKKLVRFPIIASSFTSCTRRPRGRALYCFGADLFIRSFFRADFLCAVELTKLNSSSKPTVADNKQNVPQRKPESVPARGRAINHQHPRHRPTGEQLQATEKRRQRSDEDLEQRHLRVYRSGGGYGTAGDFVTLTLIGGG